MASAYNLEGITVETTAPNRVSYAPRRFTVDEYYRMEEVGILAEDERLELIDGCIVVREPASPPHASQTKRLNHFFIGLLGDRVIVSVQDPFRIDNYNHPQPDVALLRPRADFYAVEHPGPEDAFLLVEIALTSLRADHQAKVPMYARAGIPELWIINLPDRLVEVYREPSQSGYRRIDKLGPGERLSIQAFPDVSFSVDDVLT